VKGTAPLRPLRPARCPTGRPSRVVILCGGIRTRLREASEKLPKPLVDIGGRPVLWHIMKIYGDAGFRRFVLCLGYKGDQINFRAGPNPKMNVSGQATAPGGAGIGCGVQRRVRRRWVRG
jgi:NDP-sugar pyrophosphorylase family protein